MVKREKLKQAEQRSVKRYGCWAVLFLMTVLTAGRVLPAQEPPQETRRLEITGKTADQLIKRRFHYIKNVRFCRFEADGMACNSWDRGDGGNLYLTDFGIIHRGRKIYLIRWQDIRGFSQPRGRSNKLRIRTTVPEEKLTITDYRRSGSLNSLENSMDTLLRVLEKNLKKYKDQPPKQLPGPPIPVSVPKPKKKKPTKPSNTIDIKTGMTPAEVEEQLGPPLKRISLPNKIIYQYKDMVITFINGKLSDVSIAPLPTTPAN